MTNTENKFEYNDLIYIAVEESSCRLCDFNDENKCFAPNDDVIPPCDRGNRADSRNVCFVLSDIDNKGKDK